MNHHMSQQQQSFLQQADGGDSLSKPLLGLFELIDRILDKGLVIDAYVSITVIGIPLVVIRARIVVASIDTFLRYQDAMGLRGEPGEKLSNVHHLVRYRTTNHKTIINSNNPHQCRNSNRAITTSHRRQCSSNRAMEWPLRECASLLGVELSEARWPFV